MSIYILFIPGRLFNFSLSSEMQGEVGRTSLICPIIFSSSPDGRQHYGDSTSALPSLQPFHTSCFFLLLAWATSRVCLIKIMSLFLSGILRLFISSLNSTFFTVDINLTLSASPQKSVKEVPSQTTSSSPLQNLQGCPTTFQTRLSSGSSSSFSLSSSSSSSPWKVLSLVSLPKYFHS